MQEWAFKPAADLDLSAQERWLSLRREIGLGDSLMHFIWLGFARAFLTCWNRLEVVGRENLPRQPRFVMVANHRSHLDAPALASTLPMKWRDYVSPIAAGDVFFEKRGMAAFAALVVNALPLWRRRFHGTGHALEELRGRITRKAAIYILFPEGTRSRDGRLLPFKNGIGALVAGTDVPVVPCHIAGTAEAAPVGAHFPGRHRITVRIGQALDFQSTGHDRKGWDRVAETTRHAVEHLAARQSAAQLAAPKT
jgi:1-acyl-sn-glycerol-3-phosphate acyltransferase